MKTLAPLTLRRAVQLLSLAGIWLSLLVSSAARVWTNTEGKSITASFVSQSDTEVTIRLTANNREFTLPKTQLSQGDRDYLAALDEHGFSRYFPLEETREIESGYVVVEAGGFFHLPGKGRTEWIVDLDDPSGEEPELADSPLLVRKGITRLEEKATQKKLVILGAEDFSLMEQVSGLPFINKLRIQERQALMSVLSAQKLEHGRASRAAVRALLGDESFKSLSEREQQETFLKAIEESSPDLNRNFEVVEFHKTEAKPRWQKENRYTGFQVEEPVTAWENEIKIHRVGRVPVISLREDDKTGLEAISRGLSCLPPEMVEYLGTVALHYRGEGFWWGGGNQIYYAAKDDLKFNGALVYVMAHEIGHCIQFQEVRGAWNDALQNCIVFPSAYGLTNIAEDFAEFTAIVTRAWTRPEEMLEVEEVFPWRYEIYCGAVDYDRSRSRFSEDAAAE